MNYFEMMYEVFCCLTEAKECRVPNSDVPFNFPIKLCLRNGIFYVTLHITADVCRRLYVVSISFVMAHTILKVKATLEVLLTKL